jgi:hypothetical protein
MSDHLRPANFLLPEDMFPDFSAVAVTADGANTTLFSLNSVRTEYVVLVYLPTVTMAAELLALRDNLHNFTQVRQQHSVSSTNKRAKTTVFLY